MSERAEIWEALRCACTDKKRIQENLNSLEEQLKMYKTIIRNTTKRYIVKILTDNSEHMSGDEILGQIRKDCQIDYEDFELSLTDLVFNDGLVNITEKGPFLYYRGEQSK